MSTENDVVDRVLNIIRAVDGVAHVFDYTIEVSTSEDILRQTAFVLNGVQVFQYWRVESVQTSLRFGDSAANYVPSTKVSRPYTITVDGVMPLNRAAQTEKYMRALGDAIVTEFSKYPDLHPDTIQENWVLRGCGSYTAPATVGNMAGIVTKVTVEVEVIR